MKISARTISGYDKGFTVLGIDIGVKNLALCKLHVSKEGLGNIIKNKKKRTVEVLVETDIKEWLLIDLLGGEFGPSKKTTQALLENLVAAFESRRSMFSDVDAFVIETQMTAKMKMLSSALFALLKLTYPQSRVSFQSAIKKLNFPDFTLVQIDKTNYAARKKSAILLVKTMLEFMDKQESREVFQRNKKKDDLADAFLHTLSMVRASF